MSLLAYSNGIHFCALLNDRKPVPKYENAFELTPNVPSGPIKQSSGRHALLWLSELQSFNIEFVHSNDNLGPSVNSWLKTDICFGLEFPLGIDCSRWSSVYIGTLSCTWMLQDLPPGEDKVIPHTVRLNIENWLFHLLVFFRELCHSFSEKFDWSHLDTEVPHHCQNKDSSKICLCFRCYLAH